MNCYKCKQLIDKMHSGSISNNELQSVLHHIKECESCRTYYNVMENMISDLSSFEEIELPKGFRNRLHFALKREAENPEKTSKSFSKGMKFAAIGAFSVLLILAAVSLLPNMRMNDMAFDMAMEEAAEAPKEMIAAEKSEEAGYADTSVDGDIRDDNTNSSQAFETTEAEAEEVAVEEAAETDEINPCPMVTLSDGNTVVLILDVEDIDTVYNTLLAILPEPLPEIEWMFEDISEPQEYKQIRVMMDAAEAEYSAGQIADEYAYSIEYYQNANLIYDEDGTAELQNIGYVFIVLK